MDCLHWTHHETLSILGLFICRVKFNKRGGLIAMVTIHLCSEALCAPPVSADGSPLFSFIQPTTASCTLSDSTLPCPSLSPPARQWKERFPWTFPSSAALQFLPFSLQICHQKLLPIRCLLSHSVAMSAWQAMPLLSQTSPAFSFL